MRKPIKYVEKAVTVAAQRRLGGVRPPQPDQAQPFAHP